MNIVVVGMGYTGLATAVCLAEMKHEVICVDIDEEKIQLLQKSISPIYEKDLKNLIIKNKERLYYTTDYEKAYKEAEVIFIAVDTPQKANGLIDLTYVYCVARQICKHLTRNCTIVLKSTVPVGTTDELEKHMKKELIKNVSIELVFNPEFLSQGTAIHDILEAQRIVIGTKSKKAEKLMKQIYDGFNQPYVITDRKSAEMIKYVANSFLALKISYINEIANLCEKLDANIEDVSKGIGFDNRIGNKFLNAGIGYGGSCFPKDTNALKWIGDTHSCKLHTIDATIKINEKQQLKLIEKSRKYYKTFKNINVSILGVTFKPNTDDLRNAPSLKNINILLSEGAKIKIYDPVGIEKLKKIYKTKIKYCESIEETLENTDICFLFTEWDSIKNMNILLFKKMKNPIVLDGRNCFDLKEIQGSDIIYESIGRKIIKNKEN